MGGSSKSKTSSSVTTNTRNENVSDVEDAQIFQGVGGGINILDEGAIEEAFDFGESALDFGVSSLNASSDNFDSLLDFGGQIVDNQSKALTETLQSVTAAAGVNANLQTQDFTDAIQKIGFAVAAVAAIFFISKAIRS